MTPCSTIAAISTPPGKGGVAIIRVSGSEAFAIADQVFAPKSGKPLSAFPARMQIYGDILKEGERIDDGMATRFPAPHSYTGEDTVEIACHGGVLVTKLVLESLFLAGAVPAGRGEFTRRAFLSGKLSLTDAEGIGMLIDAETVGQVRLSTGKARESLSRAVEEIRATLVSVLGSIYARIDYPDEDLGDFSREETLSLLTKAQKKLSALLASYRTGRAIGVGVKTVLCGKPNVGKSSLYNLLLGTDAAIVTDIPGTTRDVLEHSLAIGNVTLLLADTAGVRSAAGDAVEEIGIRRSVERIAGAELILAVFDRSRPFDKEDEVLLSALEDTPAKKIAILNKSDLPESEGFDEKRLADRFDAILPASAIAGEAEFLTALESVVAAFFTDGALRPGEDAIVASARQNASLGAAKAALDDAIAAYVTGVAEDAASSEIERAVEAVSEVDGRAVSEEVTADIFSRFCVGK